MALTAAGCDDAPLGIGVFRALQLGDLLCAVPALRALRSAFPRATITLIGLPWARAFASRFAHLVDAFIAFPGHASLPERVPDHAKWPAFAAQLRQARLDVTLQLHGSGATTNGILHALPVGRLVGFRPAAGAVDDSASFRPWPEQGSEVERCLALIDFLGIARQGTHLEFPLAADEVDAARDLMASHRLVPGAFVCVHPGARLASRRWPVERFASLARQLVAAGHRVVVTGTRDEAALCAEVAHGAGAGGVDLCGATSLGVLAALVSRARLVVCNDTGISHVAAATGARSVVVSCGADPQRFAPSDRLRHRVLAHMTACRPCMHERCPTAHECATGLALPVVRETVFAMLGPHSRTSSLRAA